jgi:putative membrane protein
MSLAEILPEADRVAVANAVRAAEERTGCEIVVTVVRACDGYHHASWKAATCGALAGALVTAYVTRGLEVWGLVWAWLLLPAPTGALLGWCAAQAAPLRRALATPEILQRRVAGRAAVAFLDAQVARTRERTGILLFVAWFERRVVVLCDDGVRTRLDAKAFDDVTRAVAARTLAGALGPALVEGVERAAEVLARHGFQAAAGPHENQLPDAVRVEQR